MIFGKTSMLLALCMVGLAGIGTVAPTAVRDARRSTAGTVNMKALLIKPTVAVRVRRK